VRQRLFVGERAHRRVQFFVGHCAKHHYWRVDVVARHLLVEAQQLVHGRARAAGGVVVGTVD